MNAPEGLSLSKNFIDANFENEIIQWLNSKAWNLSLSRRTQHFGAEYDYKSSNVKLGTAPELSGPILTIANKLEASGLMKPQQCIVNEYYRNQGIAPHVDSPAFGPRIIIISLGADTIMEFTRQGEIFPCLLPQRSIALLEGPARNEWKHSISKLVTYVDDNGTKIIKPQDYRRISLTYRTLK